MSDLISRSELINKIRGIVPGSQDVDFIVRLIDNQPTTYDIDKVAEELEKAKHEIASEDYCRSINDKEKCDGRNCFECCTEYLIEIVKQGVISDDLCEWIKYDYRTICPKNHDANNPYWRIPDNMDKLKYCPYCGKKIKVVE